MRIWQWAPLTLLLVAGCNSQRDLPFSGDRAAAVERDVRAYAATIAHDVTQQGPSAWRRHLADSPAFFMASEGRLVFPDSATAKAAVQYLERTIKHIELTWGNDLRVDPLTPDLAIIGSSYHEIRVDNAGHTVDESGFFTATAENKNGRWQLRNAHWSVIAPPPAVR